MRPQSRGGEWSRPSDAGKRQGPRPLAVNRLLIREVVGPKSLAPPTEPGPAARSLRYVWTFNTSTGKLPNPSTWLLSPGPASIKTEPAGTKRPAGLASSLATLTADNRI